MSKENISFSKILFTILPATFHASPLWMTIDLVAIILSSICVACKTITLQLFFDTVSLVINGEKSVGYLVLLILLTGGVQILSEALNGLCNFTWFPLGLKVNGAFSSKIHKKIGKLEAVSFENPETLDLITKAKDGVKNSNGLYNSISTIFAFYLPYFIVMGVYLYKLRPILTVLLLMIFIPLTLTQLIRVSIFSKLTDDTAPIKRKVEYYEKAIYDRQYFKETRILGIYGFFKKLHEETVMLLVNKSWKASKKVEFLELGMRIITLFGYLGVIYLLFNSLIENYITVGAFAAIFSSIDLIIRYMNDIICKYAVCVMESIGSLRSFIKFLELPEMAKNNKEADFSKGIKVKNLSFEYPGNSSKKVLDNISFDIKPKETIAIVGENGCGKTTLVKLITGVFKPTSGTVEFSGIPTSEIGERNLYSKISGVLQNFQKYKMSLKDNISISDLNKDVDVHELKLTMNEADVEIEDKLTNGIDTMLSREFNGIDLSGGQWQRIALARGLYKEHDLIVLDEPTSAIDPIEETKIYEKITEISKEKTAIIVTHRLGSTKIADRIIVLSNGKIDAIGTHDELMKQDGYYARMFNMQAKWYSKEL